MLTNEIVAYSLYTWSYFFTVELQMQMNVHCFDFLNELTGQLQEKTSTDQEPIQTSTISEHTNQTASNAISTTSISESEHKALETSEASDTTGLLLIGGSDIIGNHLNWITWFVFFTEHKNAIKYIVIVYKRYSHMPHIYTTLGYKYDEFIYS